MSVIRQAKRDCGEYIPKKNIKTNHKNVSKYISSRKSPGKALGPLDEPGAKGFVKDSRRMAEKPGALFCLCLLRGGRWGDACPLQNCWFRRDVKDLRRSCKEWTD